MEVELKGIPVEKKETLNNLLEKYNYEFSQYDQAPFDDEGLFHYPYLDQYWSEAGRYPYFIIVDHKLAGFVLINRHGACDRPVNWSVAEFFVSYPYRRKGVATIIMERIFKLHQGFWHIKYHPKNAANKIFWNKLVRSVSNGCYEIVEGNECYFDGTASQVLIFKI